MWTVMRQVCFQEKQRRHCLDRFFFFSKKVNLFNLVKHMFVKAQATARVAVPTRLAGRKTRARSQMSSGPC